MNLLICILLTILSLSPITPKLHGLSKFTLNMLKYKAYQILDNATWNTQCAEDIKFLIKDSIYMKRWALEMLDASAKLPTGLLQGNYYVSGNFEQCLDIREVKNDSVISGQYCSVVLTPSKLFSSQYSFMLDSIALSNFLGIKISAQTTDLLKIVKMTYGLCIPQSCSIENLQRIWNYIEHTFRVPAHFMFVDIMCRSRDKPIEPYSVDIYIYAFFIAYAAIILMSTLYDLIIHQQIEGKETNYLVTFSLYTNTKKLFSYSNYNEYYYLDAISGIKVLTMLWIMYGHRVLLNFVSGTTNSLYLYKWRSQLFTTFILAAAFGVDTFFTLSGLLLSFGILKYKGLLGKGNWITFTYLYLYRFLRLTPALSAVILFYIGIFKTLGDGPYWPLVAKKLAGSCLHSWWATLSFTVNYLDINYQCVEQSWYLAVDSQLYFISPIILINLMKRPWKTFLVCMIACLISGVYAFVITINNNYAAVYFDSSKTYAQNIYTPTFLRMPSWMIGVLFGFLIFKYQHIQIPKAANVTLWIISLSLMLGLVLVHMVFTNYEYNPVTAAIFNGGSRQAWSLALGIMVFLCTTGHGGIINSFLSWPIFQILVKISYSTYLVHLAVIIYSVGQKKSPEHFSNIKSIRDFMGDLLFTFIASMVLCLTFESPFIAISKNLFKNAQKAVDKGNDAFTNSRKKNRSKKKELSLVPYNPDKRLNIKKYN